MRLRAACLVMMALGMGAFVERPAAAMIGAQDAVPAATLLLPYFEVDLASPDGITTLFSVNNAAAEPAIAHVTLWTDLSVPTLDFNVYLTGYDVATFNLRDLFQEGRVPATAHDDPAVSPVGVFSTLTNPVTGAGPGSVSCDALLPLPPLPATLLSHLRSAHTGQASAVFAGLCAGTGYRHDQIARGYVTIDHVNFCTLDFPGDTGYFVSGGNGAASNRNQLWGDFLLVEPGADSAQGMPLVHLEAADDLGAGNYTFYRRYSGGADQREGLATTYLFRYGFGGAFDGTDVLVWRDSKRTISPFNCVLTAPSPFPISVSNLVLFDEQENVYTQETSPFSPPIAVGDYIPFPWEAQRNDPRDFIDEQVFPFPFDFGWVYLNLNNTVAGSQVPFEPLLQNWVGVVMRAEGRFSVGFDAVHADNVTNPLQGMDVLLPVCDGDPDPPACP